MSANPCNYLLNMAPSMAMICLLNGCVSIGPGSGDKRLDNSDQPQLQQKINISTQVVLSRIEPRLLDAAALTSIKVGNTLQNVLEIINPNGLSAKFVIVRRRENDEYLILKVELKEADKTTHINRRAGAFFVFRNAVFIGMTTWELADITNIFNNKSNPIARAMSIADALINTAIGNGINIEILRYNELIETKADPGLVVMAGVITAAGVVLNNHQGADFIVIDRLLAVKKSEDLRTIDPKAEVNTKLPYSAEHLASTAFPISNSRVGSISTALTKEAQLILGFGFWESLHIVPDM